VIDDDPVIDYMVMEAIALKVHKEDEKVRKDAERKQRMKEVREELKKYT
jgi:hypothetical protein